MSNKALQEKSLISIFQEIFTSIDKIFILVGRLGTRLDYHSIKFRHFSDIF